MFGCPEEDWKIGYINLSLPAEGSGHFYWKVILQMFSSLIRIIQTSLEKTMSCTY
jgi:hypothetical protein